MLQYNTTFTGLAYTAYGKPTIFDASMQILSSSTIENDYTYTGRRHDFETGFHYYRARYYEAILGRFTSRDPLGYEANDRNVYRFVVSNPLNSLDPSGTTLYYCCGWIGQVEICQYIWHSSTWIGKAPCFTLDKKYPGVDFKKKAMPAPEFNLANSNLCSKMSQSKSCNCCTESDCEQFLVSIFNAKLLTIVFPYWPGQCQRWIDEFERQYTASKKKQRVGGSCLTNTRLTHFTFSPPRNLGLTTGHAAYRFEFCDGSVVYIDNGAFGGVFLPGDIPSDATDDIPL